ncbi:23998_t:CDS:1 [Dentiscutata erythropus]|uniref:23998_t:CDS:1 n=1 Tax=Dentiscutata erythropus TaxID=1348616 RepID=A0A9N8YUU6_9GLOM|nr:23998_t:CDS:1 [Dentiscutata erythropus]
MCAHRAARRETLGNLLSSLQEELNLNPSQPLFKLTYASSPNWPYYLTETQPSSSTLKIAILDSSFNPPTKAHMQLLLESLKNHSNTKTNNNSKFFDACLLLYAIKNADKTPSSSDAGPVDRILMMESLASQIHSTEIEQNIATGVITHPLFMDKAKAIHSYFNNNNNNNKLTSYSIDSSIDSSSIIINYSSQISLYFILGFDTVIRLFNPQYYSNIYKELDSFFKISNIICANRDGYGGRESEEKFFQSDILKEIIGESEKIIRVKLDDNVAKISSTNVRKAIINIEQENDGGDDDKREEMIKSILYDFCPESVAEFVFQEKLYRNTR